MKKRPVLRYCGWKARPSKPRSPVAWVRALISRKGRGRSAPCCTRRMLPACSSTNSRLLPSPAWVTKVGCLRPPTTGWSATVTCAGSTADTVAAGPGDGDAGCSVAVGPAGVRAGTLTVVREGVTGTAVPGGTPADTLAALVTAGAGTVAVGAA